MAYATEQEARRDGQVIYGHNDFKVIRRANGFIYWANSHPVAMDSATTSKPIDIRTLSIKGLRELAKSNVSIDEFANAVEAVAASNNNNKVAVASDSALDSTNDELAWFVLNNIDKLSKHAVANDDVEQENKQFASDSDPLVKQYEITKAHYAAIHQRQIESAKQQTLAAKNRFKR